MKSMGLSVLMGLKSLLLTIAYEDCEPLVRGCWKGGRWAKESLTKDVGDERKAIAL